MGRGRSLTNEEKALIHALSKQSLSLSAIAREVYRSKTAVWNEFIASRKRRPILGRPPKISPAAQRAIVRAASQGHQTARMLTAKYSPPVRLRRVQQILQDE